MRNMTQDKVIVIGAGMGGLSAAIRLQYAGYQVELFEKQDIPGGKMHQIKADGHQFDVGPTLVMMPEVYQSVFHDVGKNPDDYIPLIKLEPMYHVYFKGTPYRKYSVNNNLIDLMETFEAKGQDNALGFLKYMSAIYERYQIALNHFIRRPFRNKTDMYNPFMLRQALKLKTFDSASDMMGKFIPDYDLQNMLSFQTLYIGVSPTDGPSLYNIIPMIELLYGVWTFEGGMYTMAEQMAKLFQELGGTIHYNSPVEEILIVDKAVQGVQVQGAKHYAPYVVCNADFPYAAQELIEHNQVATKKYRKENLDNLDYSCSCLVFYWGVDGTFPELEGHQFIVSENLKHNMDQIFAGELLDDPSIYLSIPSHLDPGMAPAGKSSFYLLIPVSELGMAQYPFDEEHIDYYRQKAFETLANLPGLEDLSKKITLERIMTPNDFAQQFHAYRGATFGLRPTLRQSNHWRPQAKAKEISGLYFAGSSIHPGAGVPITLESGKISAEELRRDNPKDDFT